jgi:hypothetical protein
LKSLKKKQQELKKKHHEDIGIPFEEAQDEGKYIRLRIFKMRR